MMEGGQTRFRLLDAVFIVVSILTFIADQATDLGVAVTLWSSGQATYSIVTLLLVLLPNAIVQIFSARWNKIDGIFDWPVAVIHGLLLGSLHRYYTVLRLGLSARSSGDTVDYRRYYQQWSDICMLRLFASFMESGPQLVFQVYIMCEESKWEVWAGVSAVASAVSLAWGVAAYSQALRLVREDKSKISWTGVVLQATWRFLMLAARLTAMVLLALAIGKWSVIVFLVHWLLMSAWVLWQDTDFCTNAWEERLYNGVVGVIYCFCFFNLKEGRSRYRMAAFYTIMFFENLAFMTAYYFCKFQLPGREADRLSLAAMAVVVAGTAGGLCSMLLYYRFYHPAGPIQPCGKTLEEKLAGSEVSEGPDFAIKDATYMDDKDSSDPAGKPHPELTRNTSLKHSRSVKSCARRPAAPSPATHSVGVNTLRSSNRQPPPPPPPASSPRTQEEADCSASSRSPASPTLRPPSEESAKVPSERLDSAYGTDSNRTASRNTESSVPALGKSPSGSYPPLSAHNQSGSPYNPNRSGSSNSSVAFNNETYMSIENTPGPASRDATYMDLVSPGAPEVEASPNNTYQSVHPMSETAVSHDGNTSQESAASRVTVVDQSLPLNKRSPVMRDVTADCPAGSGQPSPGKAKLHAPLTIIIPNISNQAFTKSNSQSPDKWSDKTISLDILNPETGPPDISSFSSHDYENLALVNINRAPLGPQHWRTYSDMANSWHDDSTKYDKTKLNFTSSSNYSDYSNLAFCDIYPLSKAMKEQLYRSLTPVSTAATMATSLDRSESNDSNHTYEPIETAGQAFSADGDYAAKCQSQIPVTLIHHDGHKVTANTIVNLNNLREALKQHEQIPYEDPENRGDLYLLAPMRLLTPIGEETESDLTARSRTYQSLSTYSKEYSDVDQSIMSIISEVLNSRGPDALPRSVSQSVQQAAATAETVDTNSLLSTIEEIRNNSLCNLYYGSNGEKAGSLPSLVPRVPPRNTTGYESLCAQNNKSKTSLRQETNDSLLAKKNEHDSTITNEATDPDDSIKSVASNTLVVTPTTVRTVKRQSPLQTSRGCRKNILNLVGNTRDILNTPKRPTTETLSVPHNSDVLSDSVMTTESNNEFKALMPHLTFSGAKFLHKVKKSPPLDDSSADLEAGRPDPRSRLSGASLPHATPDMSRVSAMSETPSPALFTRNIGNQAKPKRKLSIVRERSSTIQHDDDSDYKYGFMKQHPDAKYGFGYFPQESYTVVETAKLCSAASYRTFTSGISQPSPPPLSRLQPAPSPAPSHVYTLSALNKPDTVFKLNPDETYENLQRNNWGSASLQRRPSKTLLGDCHLMRDVASRRSMSILDDFTDEKENMVPVRSSRPLVAASSPVAVLGCRAGRQQLGLPVRGHRATARTSS